MKKTLALLFFAFPLCFTIEAEENKFVEGLNVIRTKASTVCGETDRSQSISADITGNTLTISFNDNVGIAHIIIKDSNGVYIDRENVFSTPDYATFFINDAGYYRMDITLSNGEQYYGYFRVEP